MHIIGIGQGGARHTPAKPHVIKLAAQRAQTRFDVAKTVSVSQLSESHRQILIPTREPSWPGIPAVAATQRRSSRSGRKLINREKTVRPSFTDHCDPSQIAPQD